MIKFLKWHWKNSTWTGKVITVAMIYLPFAIIAAIAWGFIFDSPVGFLLLIALPTAIFTIAGLIVSCVEARYESYLKSLDETRRRLQR